MAKRRKAGQGTLRLRKDGRWEGRIVVDYKENGTPKTKSVTAKTKSESRQSELQLSYVMRIESTCTSFPRSVTSR